VSSNPQPCKQFSTARRLQKNQQATFSQGNLSSDSCEGDDTPSVEVATICIPHHHLLSNLTPLM